jgi:5-hydroxyisourate hydrolase
LAGRLTTHVLDLVTGKPAAGLAIELWRCDATPFFIKRVITNADGRVEAPLLQGEELTQAVYELHFLAGDYLRRSSGEQSQPAFLDMIPIRFGVADPDQHYHVPLLLSRFGYSTYRGS